VNNWRCKVISQLTVFAGKAALADTGEIWSVIDGLGWDAGSTSQAWVVSARVWHETVGLGGWVAALTGQNVTQLALVASANPIIVIVGGVVHQG